MTIEQKILEWLAAGDTGISSKALAFEAVGMESRYRDAPHDPSDLGRCLRLIKQIPECRSAVDVLAASQKDWASLAPHWDELAAMMDDEVGIDWSKGRSAPNTYERMREVRS